MISMQIYASCMHNFSYKPYINVWNTNAKTMFRPMPIELMYWEDMLEICHCIMCIHIENMNESKSEIDSPHQVVFEFSLHRPQLEVRILDSWTSSPLRPAWVSGCRPIQ